MHLDENINTDYHNRNRFGEITKIARGRNLDVRLKYMARVYEKNNIKILQSKIK